MKVKFEIKLNFIFIFKVVETVTLVSSSEDSTKVAAVKPVEGSGSVEETNPVDCSTSDIKTSAAGAVNISAESSHTASEKVGTLFCVSRFLLLNCTYRSASNL
jgi:hypothetical protein